jgi:WD40 repeat protein
MLLVSLDMGYTGGMTVENETETHKSLRDALVKDYSEELVDTVLSMVRYRPVDRANTEMLYKKYCADMEVQDLRDQIELLKQQLKEKDQEINLLKGIQYVNSPLKRNVIPQTFEMNSVFCGTLAERRLWEWDVTTGKKLQMKMTTEGTMYASMRINNTQIACGDDDGRIIILQSKKFETIKSLQCFEKEPVTSIVGISATTIAVASRYLETVAIWDIEKGECIQSMTAKGCGAVFSLVYMGKDIVASGSKDKIIRVWNIKSGQCLMELAGHAKEVSCLAVYAENILISGSYDKTIRVWDTTAGKCITTIDAHADSVNAVIKISNDLFATASDDKTIKIWKVVKTRTLLKTSVTGVEHVSTIKDSTNKVECLCLLSPQKLASSSGSDIFVWDIESGKFLQKIDVRSRVLNIFV